MAPDEYLHLIWAELGFRRLGETLAPLEWRELQAYADMTGTRLTQEEWRIVMEMSVAYCGGLAMKNPFAMSPVEKAERERQKAVGDE